MTETPPPPGLPQAPLANAETLKVGDVVQIAVQREDRTHGGHYWQKRFAVVTKIGRRGRSIDIVNLKMRPNLEPFTRGTDVFQGLEFAVSPWGEPQVITKLKEPWPQGVAAMHMKLLVQKIIEIGDE